MSYTSYSARINSLAGGSLRGLETHSRRDVVLAQFDERLSFGYRKEGSGFCAEVLNRLIEFHNAEEAPEVVASERPNLGHLVAVLFNLADESWRGETDSGNATIAPLGSPPLAPAFGGNKGFGLEAGLLNQAGP
jgi:hypothetical protein